MHIVNHQIPYESLHHYCTKSEQSFLQSGDFIVHHLNLAEAHIYDTAVEQAFLRYLDQPLVGHHEHAEVPAEVRRREDYRADYDAGEQTETEEGHTRWIVRFGIGKDQGVDRTDQPGAHTVYQPS